MVVKLEFKMANSGGAQGDLLGSNDGENENMPELEASIEQVQEDDDEGEEEEHEVASNDDDDEDEANTPVLEHSILEQQQSNDDDNNAADENEDEEEIAEEDVALEPEDVAEAAQNLEESEEEEAENEEEGGGEEDEEDYENGGNPSVQQNNIDSSNEDENDNNDEGGPGSRDNAEQQAQLLHQQADQEEEDEEDEETGLVMDVDDSDSKNSNSVPASSVVVGAEKPGAATRKRSASLSSSSEDAPKRKQGRSVSDSKDDMSCDELTQKDKYCWVCHKDGVYFNCKICPRSYHMRCICLPDYPEPTLPESDGTSKTCICPECVVVMNAENVDKRSEAMKMLSMDQLVSMLKYICGRMKQTPGVDPFLKPVQPQDACDYYEYIIYPMDIQTLEKNIKQRQYGSTEAFLADAQWLVHNSIIFNSSSSPYTASAKRILKVCKQELSEIETCPECYTNAHTKSETWFVEACKRPHILVWAKLKGFPYWPAKAMKIKDDQVDVRFFGQHDRAWVNLKDCFLYSEEMPASPPKKNVALLAAIDELNTHISKLNEAYGKIVLASVKTPLGRELSLSEIQRLLPEFKPEEPSQQRTSTQVSGKGGGKASQMTKSPMTITISSLKTNPTIVNNSLAESPLPTSKVSNVKSTKRTTTTPNSIDGNENSSSSAAATTTTAVTSRGKANATTNVEQSSSISLEATAETNSSSLPDDDNNNNTNNNDGEEEEEPSTIPKLNEPVKETNKIGLKDSSLDDDFESRVPSGEILASALGLKRITRRVSQNEPVRSEGGDTTTKATTYSHLQAQLRKSSRVSVTPVTSELEQNQSGVSIKTEPEEAMEDSESENPIHADDQEEKSQTDAGSVVVGGTLRNKMNQDFMEHISTQAQTKPGYRFNISKDISISAIGQDNTDVQEEAKNMTAINNNRLRKSYGLGPGVTVNPAVGNVVQRHSKQQQQQQQIIHQPSPPRQRFTQSLNQQQQPGAGRFLVNKDVLAFTRMLRPASSKIQNPVPNIGSGTVRHSRAVPGAIQMSSLRGNSILHKFAKDGFKQQPIIVDSTSLRVDNSSPHHYGQNQLQKVGSAIQVNQVQSVQGAITLPGGTITVTPLSALAGGGGGNPNYTTVNMNGDRSSLKSTGSSSNSNQNSNGLPISMSSLMESNSPAITATPMKAGGKNSHSQLQQQSTASRKGIANMVPPSVVNMVPPQVVSTVQGLQKSVSELIRVAAEQIAVDMVEHSTMKNESDKNYKLEHEKLVLKHIKELTDMRMNHEIHMRELRSNMDNEKKRAIAEVRRQMELDKQKAVEEAKKKQWCALCGREALFYCCWNTSYCGYPCQEDHWPSHMGSCTQSGGSSNMNTR